MVLTETKVDGRKVKVRIATVFIAVLSPRMALLISNATRLSR